MEDTETYQVRTKDRVIDASKDYYKISAIGIDYFESTSRFRKSNPFSGIKIMKIFSN